jgi:hypothetical protein
LGQFLRELGRFLRESGQFLRESGQFLRESGQFLRESGQFLRELGRFLRELGRFLRELGRFLRELGRFLRESGLYQLILPVFADSRIGPLTGFTKGPVDDVFWKSFLSPRIITNVMRSLGDMKFPCISRFSISIP